MVLAVVMKQLKVEKHMTEEEISALVKEVLEQQGSSVHTCFLGIDKERHTREHHFIRGLIKITEKLDNIKWGFFGTMVRAIGLFLLCATVIGVIILAREKGVNIP